MRADGSHVGYAEVAKLAALNSPPIQLRVGCCCNPGGCQAALGLSDDDVRALHRRGKKCGDELDLVDGRPTGVVRASLGKDSKWEDVDALVEFLRAHFVDAEPAVEEEDGGGARELMLESLHVYPLKSCAGMAVRRWPLDAASGRLRYDREWALVDGAGSTMRLSAHPKMATIVPTIDLHARTLELRAPGLAPLVLPLNEDAASEAAAAAELRVCGEACGGEIVGGEAAARWATEAAGVQCFVARFRPPAAGGGGGGAADGAADTDTEEEARAPSLAFANEAPLLVVSRGSVDALNAQLRAAGESAVRAEHFRPNLVVADRGGSGGSGGGEDGWCELRLGDGDAAVRLRVCGPCARCAMVEVDPSSGARHGAVLRALARHRRRRARILFGVFCEPWERGGGDATLVVGASASRNWVWGRRACRASAQRSRNGMPTCNLARLEPGSSATHSPLGKGALERAELERSAIKSPTTWQRGCQRLASRSAAAGPIAAMRSFQRGQRATHSA